MSTIYVPILKWKKGEQEALKNLTENKKQMITPLIEIIDVADPSRVVEDLNKCFEHPVYLDTFYAEDYDITFLKTIVDVLKSKGREAYPVLYYDNISNDFQEISSTITKVAFRIPVPELIEGPTHQEIIDEIEKLHSINTTIGIDLILDLGVLKDSTVSIQFQVTKSILQLLSSRSIYDNIIIASTSFPEDLQSVPKSGSSEFKRLDFLLFKKIIENPTFKNIQGRLCFADYGVTKFSDSEIDFSKLRNGILPKVRYTTNDTYWVLKGEKDNRRNVWIKNYTDLAKDIINSPKYFGEEFSYGDKDIHDRALSLNKKGVGNHKDWVIIAANHHISVVVQQLSSLLGI